MVSTTSPGRCSSPRLSLAAGLFLAVTSLSRSVQALGESYPSEITPFASPEDAPSAVVVDEHAHITPLPRWRTGTRRGRHLRLRQKRQDDEDAEETSTAVNEDEDEGEEDEEEDELQPSGTKTIDESIETFTTITVSLAPTPTDDKLPDSDAPLPIPFDGQPSADFTGNGEDDSCANYMDTLLGDKTFQDCYPLSMLTETSNDFFEAKSNLVDLVQVLEAACGVDVDSCADFMSTAARNLTMEENCQAELDGGLELVKKAYNGLMAYEVMYQVSCLQDPETNQYCYAEVAARAASNDSTPPDTYMYFLPFDFSMPGGSKPSCNWCNQETMAIYHSAAADRDQAIADTYGSAAKQINTFCGLDYVNETLPAPMESAAAVSSILPWHLLASAAFVTMVLSSCL